MGPELFQELAAGAVLLTATRRLSRHTHQAFDAFQFSKGLEAWESAEILPLSAWLARAWGEGVESGAAVPGLTGVSPPQLLSSSQESALWESIIAADPGAAELLRISSAADQAARAWEMLEDWGLSFPEEAAGFSEDVRAFRRWREAFAGRLTGGGWVVQAALPRLVARWLVDGSLPVPERVILAGFDEFTPGSGALIEALRSAGCRVTVAEPPARAGKTERLDFPDA